MGDRGTLDAAGLSPRGKLRAGKPEASSSHGPRPVDCPEADQDLVERILAGEEDAFRTLVERYGPRLFRLVHGILNDWHRSEDVVQDVFVQVHRKLGSFDRRSSLLTWLYRVTVNAALKAREKTRRGMHMSLSEGYDAPATGEETGRTFELREVAAKLLRPLPEKLRTVVILREWEGLRYEEIGRVLGCSRGAVEQRLHRAMVELRRVWRPEGRKEKFHGL